MPPTTTSLRRSRLAGSSYFLLNGVALGSWVTRIPDVQDRLALSETQLGLGLLGMAVGAMIALPLSGWLVARFPTSRLLFTAGTGICLTLPLLPLAPSLPLLFLALLAFGFCIGTMEVPANAQAVLVENAYRRPLMSSFHAMFSVGGLAGAALAGVVASRGVAPFPHLLVIAAALLAMIVVARPHLLPDAPVSREPGQGHGPFFVLPRGPLLALGIIGFCVLLGEGAIADWSAVYLSDTLSSGAGVAAAGYAVFSIMMAAGRLSGDWLTERFGPARVVRSGSLIAALGLGFGLVVGTIPAALVGFACAGAGLAATFPIAMGASGRVPGVPPGTALTAVATAGYTAYLAGPPAIGFVSDLFGMRIGLGIVVALAAITALLADAVTGTSVTAIDAAASMPESVVPEG